MAGDRAVRRVRRAAGAGVVDGLHARAPDDGGSGPRFFFAIRSDAEQPIPFPHKTHIDKKAVCADCHESVEKGPIAGIPSVKTCMICHSQIATDKPLIKQVTGYAEKGIEIPWQRVYGFTREAHVRFNHAPHIRASVDCATCHGDVAELTVAERAVDHSMGFCVNCHKQKNASNDCLTLSVRSLYGQHDHGRDFIKLTAITGTSATLASCGNPEHQLIRFVPDEDLVPGVAEWKPSVCPLCAAGCGVTVRVMEADVETTRNGQAGVVKMGVAKKLEGNAKDPISRGGLCARGQASIQITYHPDRLTHPMKRTGARGSGEFKEITWDEAIAELAAQLDTLAAAKDQKSLAFLTRPHRGRRTALAGEFLKGFGAPPPIAYELFAEDVLRRANAISFGHEQLPTIDLARSRFASGLAPTSSAPGTRRWRRAPPTARCGRAVRACAARSCRSSRGCR